MNPLQQRHIILGIGVAVLVICAFLFLDMLFETDEEKIEKFIDDVSGTLEVGYVDKALTYTDLSSFPLDVRVSVYGYTHAGVYDASNRDALRKWFSERIRRFYNESIHVLGSQIEIRDQRADVSLTLISSQRLRLVVDLKMQKNEKLWWVVAANVHR